MIRFENLTAELSEEKLEQAYNDILEWRKTGVVSTDSIIRKIHENFEQSNNTQFHFFGMEQVILSEIARRYYGR